MKKVNKFIYYYGLSKIRKKKIDSENIRCYLNNKKIVNNRVLSSENVNRVIYKYLMNEKPFMAGRFGATELSAIKTFDFELKSKYNIVMNQMVMWSGFFPKSDELGKRFKDHMIPLIQEADVMGIWMLPFEEYYLKTYGNKTLETTYLLDLEPWSCPENPWSAALAGKKVLVIHPFAETIKKQYQKREKIFPGTNILPEFELKVLKAVQTIGEEKDERFETWFDALEWMYQEALKIDFDIAIIGCGAYGFPLACKLKQAGKQAIHLGGALQLMFGIKGKRWEEEGEFEYVRKYFNDAWVYPSHADKPERAKQVEGGCYW